LHKESLMATWSVERIVTAVALSYGGLEPSSEVYVAIHEDRALLVDAGTAAAAYDRIVHALRGTTPIGLLLTHHHPDHALAAPELALRLDIPIFADVREHDALRRLWCGDGSVATRADRRPPEPRRLIACPDALRVAGDTVSCIRTPGHTHGHLCAFIQSEGRLFSGDAVVPSGTVWIGPPDGHMSDYLQTLTLLESLHPSIIHPGHGEDILESAAVIRSMIARRREREEDIVRALGRPRSVAELADHLYGGKIPAAHMWAARKTCLAHLERLLDQGRVTLRFDRGRGLVYATHEGQDGY
jgi:glyoxylase-like metal-dependent hydrolase (beta-lactamase superfamily II)